jgi:hypothetical protein
MYEKLPEQIRSNEESRPIVKLPRENRPQGPGLGPQGWASLQA